MDQHAKSAEITARGTIYAVAFTGDGRHIVGGGTEGIIRRWNVQNAVEVGQTMRASGVVHALVVSKDGRLIASGDAGKKIILWNAATHEKVLDVAGHTGHVAAVDISGDSTRIASGGGDKTARIFDLTSGECLVGPLYHDNVVFGVQFSPDGNRFATATVDFASVRVYDAHSGAKLFDLPVLTKFYTTKPLSWSPDGQKLLAASSGKITSFNISTFLREEWSTQNTEARACTTTTKRAIICSAGSSVSFWDTISHEQIGRLIEHPGTVANISVSSDAKYLACGHGNTVITVYNLCDILPKAYLDDFIPLMHLSDAARESWMKNELSGTETILSEEIAQADVPSPYALANRALVRARSGRWNDAIDDTNESLKIEPSPMGYMAKALTLVGKGEQELALEVFDYVFHDCDQRENKFLLLLKAIFLFVCGICRGAISRIHRLIAAANQRPRYYYQVLGYMYLKQGDYEGAVETFNNTESLASSDDNGHLVAISLIFGWSFEGLEFTAWKCLCENLYAAGRVKEITETLSKMVENMSEDEKEAAHGRVLEEIVASSVDVTMLAWTGRSSSHNSCLPSSPDAYARTPFTFPVVTEAEMKTRTAELRKSLSPVDAGIIYGRVTGLPPVRFANFRLHLPCIVFPVKSLGKDEEGAYQAKVKGLGDVEFRTADLLLLKEPRNLVFVNPWIRDLEGASGGITAQETTDSERGSNEDSVDTSDVDAELVRVSIVEEASQAPLDEYTRALQLVARLGQPFTALLLLKQPDGAFKRVAADHEIVVSGLGSNVPKDIRAEVLEIL